jgi:TRAP-type mannitol/chloroaromatic compound transport system permease small subunit
MLLMVMGTVTVVILRYLLGTGAIVVQESVMYLHALTLLLGIPYALKEDAHVRVDVLRGRLGERGRLRVELLGHLLFLVPVAATVLYLSLPYVASSWRILERSPEVGGLPAVFLLKTLIPLMAALLLIQGAAEIGRCLLLLRTRRG